MKSLSLFLLMLVLAPVASGDIYKSVDEEGNVIFGDTPADDAAEKYVPQDTNTISLPKWSPAAEPEATDPEFRYSTLQIDSPKNDELVLSNSFAVSVTVGLKPALKDEHSITVTLDGNSVVTNSRELQHQLTTDGPGPHSLSVAIYDGARQIQQSETVNFFSRRRTLGGANLNVGPKDARGNVYTPGPVGVRFEPGPAPAPSQGN